MLVKGYFNALLGDSGERTARHTDVRPPNITNVLLTTPLAPATSHPPLFGVTSKHAGRIQRPALLFFCRFR